MAARLAALAKLSDDHLPALRAVWEASAADLSTLGRVYGVDSDGFCRFIFNERVILGYDSVYFATWSPVIAMRTYLLRSSDIEQRKALLKRVVDAAVPADTPRPPILTLLQAYQLWAKTALWDSPMMDLNKRMKQFIRQCGWMYFPGLALPTVVSPTPVEPSAPPAPVEEEWPIEPMDDPIIEPDYDRITVLMNMAGNITI
jgi:hypothetical protein